MTSDIALSLILPVYNEVESLALLWQELTTVLPGLAESTEVIFVDDGSTDGSAEVIRRLMTEAPRIRLLRLETNAGLSAAFYAGFQAARGRIVASMDSDMQSDPRDLATLLAGLASADAVVGWRQIRHDTWLKRISSRIANGIRQAMTGDPLPDSACSLRVMRRECVAAVPPYAGMHRFIPTLLTLAGFRVAQVPVHHRPRQFGRSKFGVRNRALRAFVDLLAVLWMMRRRLRYRIIEDLEGQTREMPGSGPGGNGPGAEPTARRGGPRPGRAALTRPAALFVALTFAAVIFAIPLARAPIWETNDARYVLLAQDIVEHGRWLVPEVRGGRAEGLYKPPLYFWSLALVSLPLGHVIELTAAIPSVASALWGVAGVVAIACRLWNVRAGLLAGLILTTTPNYFVFAQRSLPDVMMTAWMIWALYFLVGTRPDGSLRSLLGFYGCVGGAMLSKGPVGLAALAAAIVATWMTEGRSGLRTLRLGLGTLLLGLMATVWVLPYLLAEPRAFVSNVLVGEYGAWFFRKHGLLYRAAHMPSVLLYFAPWTIYLAGAVVWWWRAEPDAGRRRVLYWTMALWVLVGLSGIYRDRYYLPVYPGLALLTAQFFAQASSDAGRRMLRIGSVVFVVLAIAVAALMTVSVTPSGEGAVYWPDRVWERGLIALLLMLGAVQVRRLVRREAFLGVALSVALVLGAIEAVEGVTSPLRRARDYDVPALAAVAAAHVPPDGTVIGYPDLSLEWDVYLRCRVREIGSIDGVVRLLGGPSRDVFIMTAQRWAEVAGRASLSWRVLAARRIGDREMVVIGPEGLVQGAVDQARN